MARDDTIQAGSITPEMETSQLHAAAELLKAARHVAALTGAGISAESGLPTFRGADGLWRGRSAMQLATPEAFADDPALVWQFYNWRRELVRKAQPNAVHRAMVELAAGAAGAAKFTLITQNVDRLHHRAGSRDVIELHGNLADVRCTGCTKTTDRGNEVLDDLPTCDACGALLRPAVVWFGEPLPQDAWQQAHAAVTDADVLLVIGTSAVVYPAAGLASIAKDSGAKVIEINLEPTEVGAIADLGLYGKAAAVLPQLVSLVKTGD
jgi:NAD-dependent deacetylase